MHKAFLVMTVLVGLVPPAVASQATAPIEIEDVLTMRVDGEVVVDATGRLVSHTINATARSFKGIPRSA